MPTYTLILLRHGESTGNANGLYQGQADFPLSEKGQEQARLLAEYWRNQQVHFDLAIASPLLRASQTAEIVTAALGVPLELEPDWMERNNGRMNGLGLAEVQKYAPLGKFTSVYDPIGETGESQWELYLRACRAVHKLMQHPPGSYLVVSHGGLLNMAIYAILGLTPQPNFHGPRFRFRNTAYASFTYYPSEHVWRVLGVNDYPHLPYDPEEPEIDWTKLRDQQE